MGFDPTQYLDIPNAPRASVLPDFTIGHYEVVPVIAPGSAYLQHGTIGAFTPNDHWLILDKPIVSWCIGIADGKGTLIIQIAYLDAPVLTWLDWRCFLFNSAPAINTMEGLYVPGYIMRLKYTAFTNSVLYGTVKAEAL